MITKLIDGAKKSRTIRAAYFDAILGAVIGVAPTAFATISGAPALSEHPMMSEYIVYYGCIGIGVSEFVRAINRVRLRYLTTGSVGENQ